MISTQHIAMITQPEQPATLMALWERKTCAYDAVARSTDYAYRTVIACHMHMVPSQARFLPTVRTQPKSWISRKKQNKASRKAGWLSPFSRYKYTGRELNPFGSMFYRYRTYFAGVGRFGGRDPVGYKNNAQGNLYDYVYSNPVYMLDPYGLKGKKAKKAFKGQFVINGKKIDAKVYCQ